uniref:Cnidarian restricted protein n=1 Tax=Clytia hemisphaerica TaxID=252671 RepID=A0A7M5WZY8_9CNID
MKTFVCVSLCLLVFFKNEGDATKTPGQSLDDVLTALKSEVATLQNTDSDLIKKINKIEQDLKGLKLIHGPCAPCRSIPGDRKNCDCTEYRPKKDCLEFYKSGFKVCKIIWRIKGQATKQRYYMRKIYTSQFCPDFCLLFIRYLDFGINL